MVYDELQFYASFTSPGAVITDLLGSVTCKRSGDDDWNHDEVKMLKEGECWRDWSVEMVIMVLMAVGSTNNKMNLSYY